MSYLSDMDLIKEYSNNKRHGITICEDCFFIPVRITGLGKTQRLDEEATLKNIREALNVDESLSLNEIKDLAKSKDVDLNNYAVWYSLDRQAGDFATSEAFEAYNGLPIIQEHPEVDGVKTKLNFNTIKNNVIIGSIVKAYLKGKSVWGLAKIYDLTLLDRLDELKSTSPAVSSIHIETNGELIEKPKHFNHLAFVDKGHWDVKGDDGYDASELYFNLKGKNMADEVKTEAKEEVKADAITEKLDDDTKEKVENLTETEKKEGEAFKKLAKEHEKLDERNEMAKKDEKLDNQVVKLPEEEEKLDKADNDLDVENIDEAEEAKKDDEKKETKADAEADLKEDKCDSDDEAKEEDKKETKADADETLSDSETTLLDRERAHLLDSFRIAIDKADSSLNLRMPYIEGRLSPSATITKILKLNSDFVDSKYKDLIFDEKNAKNGNNYQLLIDSYNNLLSNITEKTNEVRKANSMSKKRGYWEATDKPHIKIDRNF